MFYFKNLIILFVLLAVLSVESTENNVKEKKLPHNKSMESGLMQHGSSSQNAFAHSYPISYTSFQLFIKSLDYIITARKAPGEMSITPNTLDYLITTPIEFRMACLEAYRNRLKLLHLDFSTPGKEEEKGKLAFLALEEVCNKTVKNFLTSVPKNGTAATTLNSLLTRGDILCFFSFENSHSIAEDQLKSEMDKLLSKNGYMLDKEAKLEILLNHYHSRPTKSAPPTPEPARAPVSPPSKIKNRCIRLFSKCFNLDDD